MQRQLREVAHVMRCCCAVLLWLGSKRMSLNDHECAPITAVRYADQCMPIRQSVTRAKQQRHKPPTKHPSFPNARRHAPAQPPPPEAPPPSRPALRQPAAKCCHLGVATFSPLSQSQTGAAASRSPAALAGRRHRGRASVSEGPPRLGVQTPSAAAAAVTPVGPPAVSCVRGCVCLSISGTYGLCIATNAFPAIQAVVEVPEPPNRHS